MSEHKIEHMVEKMDRHLDLSADQETQIKEIMMSNLDSFKGLMPSRERMRSELLELDPQSPEFDSSVNRLADEAADMVREKAVQLAGMMKQVSGVLTEEQRAEAREMIQERIDHHRKWHDTKNG